MTDSDGGVNVTLVDLKVLPEPDYPPLAKRWQRRGPETAQFRGNSEREW